LTAAQIAALQERQEKERKHQVLCAGIVAAAIYNCNLAEGADPVSPLDFVEKRPETSDEEKAAQFLALLNSTKAKR